MEGASRGGGRRRSPARIRTRSIHTACVLLVLFAVVSAQTTSESNRATNLVFVDLDAASDFAKLVPSAPYCPTLKVDSWAGRNGTIAGSVSVSGTTAPPSFALATVEYQVDFGVQESYNTYYGSWWNRPSDAQPSVSVADGSWSVSVNDADLVNLYLVPSSASVPLTQGNRYLPDALESLAVSRSVLALGPTTRQLQWSGKVWAKKVAKFTQLDPGANFWSNRDEDVWVDDQGKLHLTLKRATQTTDDGFLQGRWYSTEVVLQDIMGYGTYIWYLDAPVPWVDPYAVLGIFFWEEEATGISPWRHREIAFEFSQFGVGADPTNFQFGSAYDPNPAIGRPENATIRVNINDLKQAKNVPASQTKYTLHLTWTSGRAVFRVYPDWICKSKLMTKVERDAQTLLAEEVIEYPNIPTPGRQRVRMNMWKFPDTTGGDRQPQDRTYEAIFGGFDYVPGGPVPTSAQMPDCTTVKVAFDQRIALPRSKSLVSFSPSFVGSNADPADLASTDCSMLDAASLALVGGADAKCTITGPSEITIQLGASATVMPGASINLRPNTVATSTVTCGDAEPLVTWRAVVPSELSSCSSTTSTGLSASWNPGATIGVTQPTGSDKLDTVLDARFKAPTAMHPCNNLMLDASTTGGTCGRRVIYKWGFETLAPNNISVDAIRAIVESANSTIVQIPKELFDPGQTYTFSLTVTNAFGLSSTTKQSTAVFPIDVPIAIIYGARDFFPRSESLHLDTDLIPAYCLGITLGQLPPLGFDWAVRALSPPGPELAIPDASFDSSRRQLIIPVKALTPGTLYGFTFRAYQIEKPTVYGEAFAMAFAKYSPLIVDIPETDRTVTQQVPERLTCQATDPDAGSTGTWQPAPAEQRRRLANLIDDFTTRTNRRRALLGDEHVVVKPTVDEISCISGGTDGTCVIYFGYDNPSTRTVVQHVVTEPGTAPTYNTLYLPFGVSNVSIPHEFIPGRQYKVFYITVPCVPCTQTYAWALKTSSADSAITASANPCFPPTDSAPTFDTTSKKCTVIKPDTAVVQTSDASYEWYCEDLSAAGTPCSEFIEAFSGGIPTGDTLNFMFRPGFNFPFKFTCNGYVGNKAGKDYVTLTSVAGNGPTVLVYGVFDEYGKPFPKIQDGDRYIPIVPWNRPLMFQTKVTSNVPVGTDPTVTYEWSLPPSDIALEYGKTISTTSRYNVPTLIVMKNVVTPGAIYRATVTAQDALNNVASGYVEFKVGTPPLTRSPIGGLIVTPTNGTAMGSGPETTLFRLTALDWYSPFGPVDFKFYYIPPRQQQNNTIWLFEDIVNGTVRNDTDGREELISGWNPSNTRGNVLLPAGVLPYYYITCVVYVRDIYGTEVRAFTRASVLPPRLTIWSITNRTVGWAADMINIGDPGAGLNSILAGAHLINWGANGTAATCSVSLPALVSSWSDDDPANPTDEAEYMYMKGHYIVQNEGRTAIRGSLTVTCQQVSTFASIAETGNPLETRIPYSNPYSNDGGLNQRLHPDNTIYDDSFNLTDVGWAMPVGGSSSFDLINLAMPESLDKLMTLAANITYQLSRGSIPDAEVEKCINVINGIFGNTNTDAIMTGTTRTAAGILSELLRVIEAGQLPYDVTYAAVESLNRMLWNQNQPNDVATGRPDAPSVKLSNITISSIFVTVNYPSSVNPSDVIMTIVYRKGPEDAEPVLLESLPNGQNSFNDEGLHYGTVYTYTATFTLSNAITSQFSDPVSGLTLLPVVPTPVITEIIDVTENFVQLAFTAEWTTNGIDVDSIQANHTQYPISVLSAPTKRRANRRMLAAGELAFNVPRVRVTEFGALNFSDFDLAPGSVYDYNIMAHAESGAFSAGSPEYRITTSAQVAVRAYLRRRFERSGDDVTLLVKEDVTPKLDVTLPYLDKGVLPGRVIIYSARYAVLNYEKLYFSRWTENIPVYTPPSPPAIEATPVNSTCVSVTVSCPADATEQYIRNVTIYRDGTPIATLPACDGNTDPVTIVDCGVIPGGDHTYTSTFNGDHGTTSESSQAAPTELPPSPPTLGKENVKDKSADINIFLPTDGSATGNNSVVGAYLLRNGEPVNDVSGGPLNEGGWVEGPGDWTYPDSALSPGTEYTYEAYIVRENGLKSATSEPLTFWTPCSPPQVEATSPTTDCITVIITLQDPVSSALVINVTRSTEGEAPVDVRSIIVQPNVTVYSFEDCGLNAGRPYNYTATVDGKGDTTSDPSKPAEESTVPPPPILTLGPDPITKDNATFTISVPDGTNADDIKSFNVYCNDKKIASVTLPADQSSVTFTHDIHIPGHFCNYSAEIVSKWDEVSKESEDLPLTTSPLAPFPAWVPSGEDASEDQKCRFKNTIKATEVTITVAYPKDDPSGAESGSTVTLLVLVVNGPSGQEQVLTPHTDAQNYNITIVNLQPDTVYMIITYYHGIGTARSFNSSVTVRTAPSPPSVEITDTSKTHVFLSLEYPQTGGSFLDIDLKRLLADTEEWNPVVGSPFQPGTHNDSAGILPGRYYSYIGRIVTAVSGVCSDWSTAVSNWTEIYPPIIHVDPANKTLSGLGPAVTNESVRINIEYQTLENWRVVSVVYLYRNRSEASIGDLVVYGQPDRSTELSPPTLIDLTAKPGNRYNYVARFDGPGEVTSDWSNEIWVTTPPSAPILSLIYADDDIITIDVLPPTDGSAFNPDVPVSIFIIRVVVNETGRFPSDPIRVDEFGPWNDYGISPDAPA
eukprot:tig00000431_g675.t1